MGLTWEEQKEMDVCQSVQLVQKTKSVGDEWLDGRQSKCTTRVKDRECWRPIVTGFQCVNDT